MNDLLIKAMRVYCDREQAISDFRQDNQQWIDKIAEFLAYEKGYRIGQQLPNELKITDFFGGLNSYPEKFEIVVYAIFYHGYTRLFIETVNKRDLEC